MSWTWSDIGNAVASVAPTIAGAAANFAIPGSGVIAAAGAKYLLDAIGVGGDPVEQSTIDAAQAVLMSGNPEILLRLREQEAKFKTDMAKIDVDMETVVASDRASARLREVEVKDKTPSILAYITTCEVAVMAVAIVGTGVTGHLEVGPVAAGLIGTIVGSLLAAQVTMFGYYYGSSRSSKAKDTSIAALTEAAVSDKKPLVLPVSPE